MPLWWNWQTRGTQNPVVAIPCRFDPDQRHQNNGQGFSLSVIFCVDWRWRHKILILGSHFRKEILMQGISPQSEPTSGMILTK